MQQRIANISLILAAFFLSIYPQAVTFFFILFGVCSVNKENIKKYWKSTPKVVLFLFIGLYSSYILGLLYTQNMQDGLLQIQSKVALIAFPLVMILNKQVAIKKIMSAFVVGCIVAAILCLIAAAYRYLIISHNLAEFYYTRLSVFHHASYFALFICFSLAILYAHFTKVYELVFFKNKWVLILSIILLTLMLGFLSSKTGVIAFFLLIVTILIYSIKQKWYKHALPLLSVGIIFYIILNFVFTHASERFQNAERVVSAKNINFSAAESTSMRIQVWQAGWDLIKKNPLFGVGTGDVYDALMQSYEEKHFSAAIETKLNVHNQFLQTTIGLGVVGGLLLVGILGYMLVIGFRNNDFILIFFSSVIALNFLTESMLEREGGLLFFCFWASVLVFHRPEKVSITPLDNINKEN